jgi:hypothetical protein
MNSISRNEMGDIAVPAVEKPAASLHTNDLCCLKERNGV